MLHANPKAKSTLDILWAGAEEMVAIEGVYGSHFFGADECHDSSGLSFTTTGSPESTGFQNPGDINQALIELGSTVCKVQNPSCSSCPLNQWCGAYQKTLNGEQQEVSHASRPFLSSLFRPMTIPRVLQLYRTSKIFAPSANRFPRRSM
jgi:A/G-specific adenine glycosylase